MSGFILCLLIHFKYLFINSYQRSFFYMYISKVQRITIKKAVFTFVFRLCFWYQCGEKYHNGSAGHSYALFVLFCLLCVCDNIMMFYCLKDIKAQKPPFQVYFPFVCLKSSGKSIFFVYLFGKYWALDEDSIESVDHFSNITSVQNVNSENFFRLEIV